MDWQVPLDYANPTTNGTNGSVILALLRLPATNKANYKGPLFLNFGGPKASGTEGLLGNARRLRSVVGDAYDLVGWDPRGTGSTLPVVTCHPDAKTREQITLTRSSALMLAANDTLGQLDAVQQVIAAGCDAYSGHLLPFVGTVPTVRDLSHLVDIYGYSGKLSYW